MLRTALAFPKSAVRDFSIQTHPFLADDSCLPNGISPQCCFQLKIDSSHHDPVSLLNTDCGKDFFALNIPSISPAILPQEDPHATRQCRPFFGIL